MTTSGICDHRIAKMENFRKRRIELMQQFFPLRIPIRLSKANGVILKLFPLDKKQITSSLLQTGTNLQFLKSGRCRNQRQRLLQRRLIGYRLLKPHIENGLLKNHAIDCPVFFQSAKNCSIPLSVNGCLTKLFKTAAGAVA